MWRLRICLQPKTAGLLLAAAWLWGCGARIHTGAVAPVADEAPPSVLLGLHATSFYLAGVSVRGMASPEMGMMATGLEVALPAGQRSMRLTPKPNKKKRRRKRSPYFFTPSAAAGIHAAQLDWTAGSATFGAGSPYAQLGGGVCRRKRSDDRCVTLNLEGSHLVRFEEENQTWLGASVAITWFNDSVGGY